MASRFPHRKLTRSKSADRFEVKPADVSPRFVVVSGMPLLLRGWNGVYHFNEGSLNIEYTYPTHSYWGIPIRPVKIILHDGKWHLLTDDIVTETISKSVGPSIFGEWEGDVVVSAENGLREWWRNNSCLMAMAAIVCLAVGTTYSLC